MSTTTPDLRISEYAPVAPTTDFPAGFPVFDNDDIKVFVDGAERDDFAVSATYDQGISTNAKVVFAVAVTGKVLVVGARDPHRTNRFGNGGGIPARDLNLALDTLEAESQEARRDIDRSHKAPFGENGGVFSASDIANAQENAEIAGEAADAALEAQAAAEAAAAVAQAAAHNNLLFITRASAASASISTSIHSIEIKGLLAENDGDGGLYSDVNNGSNDTFTSADGRTWYRTRDVSRSRLATDILPAPYFGPVAGPTRQCVVSSSVNKQIMSFQSYRAYSPSRNITLVFPNWYIDASNQEVGPGGSATITASVEYPLGTFNQVRFSGATSGTIPNGGSILSDPVEINLPEGAYFRVRAFYANSAGLVYSNAPGEGILDEGGSEFAPSGITDKTMTGEPISQSTLNIYGPVAILGIADRPTVAIHGDSRAWGVGDTIDGTQDAGNLQRTMSTRFAVVNLAKSGDSAAQYLASSSRRRAIANYCSHIAVEYGINDMRNLGAPSSQVVSSVESIISQYPNKPVFVTTLEPITTSTDNWATLTNQTVHGTNTDRVAYNNAVRSGLAGAAGYFEIADVLESSRNSGKWKVTGEPNGYTGDGLHENRSGYLLIPESGAIDFNSLMPGVVPATGFATLRQMQQGKAKNLAVSPAILLGEIGIFTPTIVGSTSAGVGTYGDRGGAYRKFGNLVFFQLAIEWSAHTGTGALDIGGLPFGQYTQLASSQVYSVNCYGLTYTVGDQVVATATTFGGDGKRMRLFLMRSGASAPIAASMVNAGYIAVTGFYFTGDI